MMAIKLKKKKAGLPWARWVITLLVLAIVAMTGLWGAGSVLPEDQAVIRGVYIKAPVEKVWAALNDYPGMTSWLGVSEVSRLPNEEGKPIWELKRESGSSMKLQIDEVIAPAPVEAAPEASEPEAKPAEKNAEAKIVKKAEAPAEANMPSPPASQQRRLRLRLLDAPGLSDGSWTFELTPQREGTFVKLSQTGQIGNPLWRFLSHYVFGTDIGMREFLRALGRKFDQKVVIEEMVA